MIGRTYWLGSLGIHLALIFSLFRLPYAPPSRLERPLEILLLPPSRSEASSSPAVRPTQTDSSDLGLGLSRMESLARPPPLGWRAFVPPSEDVVDIGYYIPRPWADDGSGITALAPPPWEGLILSQAERPASGFSMSWLEGEELIAVQPDALAFANLVLESAYEIRVRLTVGPAGLAGRIHKTVTGHPDIDAAVDRFLDSLKFRPTEEDREVQLVLRLVPGEALR